MTGWLSRIRTRLGASPFTIAEALALAVGVEIGLRRHRFEQVLAIAMDPKRASAVRSIDSRRLDRAIHLAYRVLPFEATCLKRSLVFCVARRRRGLPAELRIGVQKNEGVFAAHAWVEDGAGTVLTDPQDGFTAVPLPPTRIRDARAID